MAELSPPDIVRRVELTADPAPGGQQGLESGHGIVDPYRAVTEAVPGAHGTPIAGVKPPAVDPAVQRRSRWRHWVSVVAVTTGLLTGFALILAWAGGIILPRGRRRRWQQTRAPRPVTPADPEPTDDDEQLFAVPKPHG